MHKRYFLGVFCMLAAWSTSYTSVHISHQLTIGNAAQASEVRWVPDPKRGRASNTLSGGCRGTASAT